MRGLEDIPKDMEFVNAIEMVLKGAVGRGFQGPPAGPRSDIGGLKGPWIYLGCLC